MDMKHIFRGKVRIVYCDLIFHFRQQDSEILGFCSEEIQFSTFEFRRRRLLLRGGISHEDADGRG